jgi:hypothetical protein
MSNHDGGYMLNDILSWFSKAGVLSEMSKSKRSSLLRLIWSLSNRWDCNWYEIIDTDLAVSLAVCRECQRSSRRIDPKEGICPRCWKGRDADGIRGDQGRPSE